MQIQILAEDWTSRHLVAFAVLLGSVAGADKKPKRVTCDLCGGTGEVWGR